MNFDDSGRTIAEDVMFSGLSEFPLPPAVVTLRSGLRRIVLRLLQQSGSENDHSNSNSSSDLDTRDSIICVAYICLLTCCCLTPCLYFLRISAWHRRRMRQLRDLERAGIVAALAQSYLQHYQNNNDGDHNNNITRNEAVHAERKALILKLLEPVQMVSSAIFTLSGSYLFNEMISISAKG